MSYTPLRVEVTASFAIQTTSLEERDTVYASLRRDLEALEMKYGYREGRRVHVSGSFGPPGIVHSA